MAYNIEPTNCDEGELLKAKENCLSLAASMPGPNGQVNSAETIVANAQKFWDFLLKTDEDNAQP